MPRQYESSKSQLKRAFDYPYPRPSTSFIFKGTQTPILVPTSLEALLNHGGAPRKFILAIGSNASPEQLLRKYGDLSQQPLSAESEIPVVETEVYELDVVYAPFLARYGSVPATVCASVGTVLKIHATLLTAAQMSVMHASESAYHFVRLIDTDVRIPALDLLVTCPVYAYVAYDGVLHDDRGWPMAVEEVTGEGRLFRLVSQRGVQNYLKGVLDAAMPEMSKESVEECIVKNIRGDVRRGRVNDVMKEKAIEVGGEGVWWEIESEDDETCKEK